MMRGWAVRGCLDDDGKRYVEIGYPLAIPVIALRVPVEEIAQFIQMLAEGKRQAEQLK